MTTVENSSRSALSVVLPMTVASAVLTVVGLVLPWVDTGSRTRSSIGLIGTAGALDVIEGPTRLVVVLGWLALPILVAGSFFAWASGRPRLVAALLLPVGPVLVVVVGLMVVVARGSLVWGAWLTAFFALATTVGSIVLVLGGLRG